MKSQNVTFADGFFVIACPHCSNGLSLDEQQLGQINDQLGGKYACPQSACAQEIEFPSNEEAAAIKAAAVTSPSPGPQPAPSPSGAAPAPPPQANPAAKPTPPPETNPAAEPTSPSPETPKQEAPANETSPAKAEDEIVVGFGGGSTATLEREAAGLHKLSVKTILHSDCVADKKDTFDDVVSKFLSSLEEENLVAVHPVNYTADEKKGSDFGVMILYKTVPKED
jgi:hypothetical protein